MAVPSASDDPPDGTDERGALHCVGCGRLASACEASCGRSSGPARFCPTCGRRAREIAVSPGLVEAQCRDHGPAPTDRTNATNS